MTSSTRADAEPTSVRSRAASNTRPPFLEVSGRAVCTLPPGDAILLSVATVVTLMVLRVNMAKTSGRQPRWLVLVHQLPPRPSNLRVRIWRRLQQIGAVALRGAGVRAAEYVRGAGRLRVDPRGSCEPRWSGQHPDGTSRRRVHGRRTGGSVPARSRDGVRDARSGHREHPQAARARPEPGADPGAPARSREAPRALSCPASSDFFGSPAAGHAQAALVAIEGLTVTASAAARSTSRIEPRSFRGRTWLTRPIRVSTAWRWRG